MRPDRKKRRIKGEVVEKRRGRNRTKLQWGQGGEGKERGEEKRSGEYPVARVCVDGGDRKEQGRESTGRKVKSRMSTHQRQDIVKEYKLDGGRMRPRKSGYRVNHRSRDINGNRIETKMGRVHPIEKVGDAGAGEVGWGTRRDGGRRMGWGTRRVPNRYDYFMEGHTINRYSTRRAKHSVTSRTAAR
jgi:hypothetical protein